MTTQTTYNALKQAQNQYLEQTTTKQQTLNQQANTIDNLQNTIQNKINQQQQLQKYATKISNLGQLKANIKLLDSSQQLQQLTQQQNEYQNYYQQAQKELQKQENEIKEKYDNFYETNPYYTETPITTNENQTQGIIITENQKDKNNNNILTIQNYTRTNQNTPWILTHTSIQPRQKVFPTEKEIQQQNQIYESTNKHNKKDYNKLLNQIQKTIKAYEQKQPWQELSPKTKAQLKAWTTTETKPEQKALLTYPNLHDYVKEHTKPKVILLKKEEPKETIKETKFDYPGIKLSPGLTSLVLQKSPSTTKKEVWETINEASKGIDETIGKVGASGASIIFSKIHSKKPENEAKIRKIEEETKFIGQEAAKTIKLLTPIGRAIEIGKYETPEKAITEALPMVALGTGIGIYNKAGKFIGYTLNEASGGKVLVKKVNGTIEYIPTKTVGKIIKGGSEFSNKYAIPGIMATQTIESITPIAEAYTTKGKEETKKELEIWRKSMAGAIIGGNIGSKIGSKISKAYDPYIKQIETQARTPKDITISKKGETATIKPEEIKPTYQTIYYDLKGKIPDIVEDIRLTNVKALKGNKKSTKSNIERTNKTSRRRNVCIRKLSWRHTNKKDKTRKTVRRHRPSNKKP